MLNHFNFKRIDNNCILVTNDFGLHRFLSASEFKALATNQVTPGSALYEQLHQGLFLLEPMELYSGEIAADLREMKNYVFTSTSLHIFVVTNACNLQCIYCQAQASKDRKNGMMSIEVGTRAIDIALQSPSQTLTFEFQGGEPLVNFSTIQAMVEYAEGHKGDKHIEYTIVSNLTLATDEILDFLISHNFSISTSLDGPKDLHDCNRRFVGRGSSYDYVIAGARKIQEKGYSVSAIQTTTRYSLPRAKDIVNEYLRMGTAGVFLRPLTPLGFAKADWELIGYSPEEFIAFYKDAFSEILRINKSGIRFPEQHATYFLKKILHGHAYNYMELRSPCGAGVGQMAYYYDGKIYTCDEGRMVAEAGDDAFCLGNVYADNYETLINSDTCKVTCASSVLETIPGCCDCVYHPYCGVCPVVNYAMDGDIFARQAHGYRCKVYAGILDHIFSLLRENDEEIMRILYSWIEDGCYENCKEGEIHGCGESI